VKHINLDAIAKRERFTANFRPKVIRDLEKEARKIGVRPGHLAEKIIKTVLADPGYPIDISNLNALIIKSTAKTKKKK
jgi:hypothetical protein